MHLQQDVSGVAQLDNLATTSDHDSTRSSYDALARVAIYRQMREEKIPSVEPCLERVMAPLEGGAGYFPRQQQLCGRVGVGQCFKIIGRSLP